LSLAVVGAAHPNKRGPTRRFEISVSHPGEPVELRPEPKNPADENAVAVFSCRDVQLGYITAERAPWIGGMINQGREVRAIFQWATTYGAVIRIAFDGEQPSIEGLRKPLSEGGSQLPDQEFYPDPEWPDD